MCATGYASALLAAGLQLGFKRDNFAKEMFDAGHVRASDCEDTGKASALLAAGLQLGFKRDNFAKEMFDAGHVQASDREDTGKASGTRYCQQVR